MLEVLINFICAITLGIIGFFVINKILDSKEKLTIKTIIILCINGICISLFHYFDYNSTLINFIINIVTYKLIFKINIKDAILVTGIVFLFILIADIISLLSQLLFIPLYKYTSNSYIYLINNLSVIIISIILLKIDIVLRYLKKIYKTLSKNSYILNTIFIILIIIIASGIMYNLFINYKVDYKVFVDAIILISLLVISGIFVNNKITYNRLFNEYDMLLEHVSTFESWIEREQFTRHEYKNQLAIIYSISKEKEVKNKIQDIINQQLNIDNEVVCNLKVLPQSTLKGILYYKTIIAQNKKINITVDISIRENSLFKKLDKNKIDILAKIMGIYYDNAIEAAKESRKKIILLEIYELKDKAVIVLSNTFKKSSIIENQHIKGVSSKGKGRGNGLYFANKILSNNKWIDEKHEIIDKYYIETISIKKSTLK